MPAYRVQCCTFNSHLARGLSLGDVQEDLTAWISPSKSSEGRRTVEAPDFVAVGYQEMIPMVRCLLLPLSERPLIVFFASTPLSPVSPPPPSPAMTTASSTPSSPSTPPHVARSGPPPLVMPKSLDGPSAESLFSSTLDEGASLSE
jgi:hypothetical protein